MTTNNNISIGYYGASGGFLLLHLLLLSGQYCIKFKDDVVFADVLQKQWDIKNHNTWKSHEFWPDNDRTELDCTTKNKIYFYCNPTADQFAIQSARTIFLYTDITSQLLLAQYKNAFWYHGGMSDFVYNLRFIRLWKNHYSNIKDPSWPNCTSHRHINQLPDWIQTEVLQNEYTQQFMGCNNWRDYFVRHNTKMYRGVRVFDAAADLLDQSNDGILLQDLINSRAQILVDKSLIPEVTTHHLHLIDRWISLHSTELLEKIGIKI